MIAKIVLVGDNNSKKDLFLYSFYNKTNIKNDDYIISTFDAETRYFENSGVTLNIFDTSKF